MRIQKHDFVLIDDELKCRLIKIVDAKIKIKGNFINLLFLVNKKYGSTFTYMNKKWIRSAKKKSRLEIEQNEDIKETNEHIAYNSNSQMLTEENILKLKEENPENPYDVIQKLVDNSTSYNEKTVISKFKYVQKKIKRHFCQFTVYECSILNLINFYYKIHPEKVSNVRADYLANIIFHLNRDLYYKNEKEEEDDDDDDKKQNDKIEKNVYEKDDNSLLGNTHIINKNNEVDNKHEEYYNVEVKSDKEKKYIGDNILEEVNVDDDIFFKRNILIYDDSQGLLSGVINIIYKNNVNIFSLIYKNYCNTITSSFGVKKYSNVVHINILNSNKHSQQKKYIQLNSDFNFVYPSGEVAHNNVEESVGDKCIVKTADTDLQKIKAKLYPNDKTESNVSISSNNVNNKDEKNKLPGEYSTSYPLDYLPENDKSSCNNNINYNNTAEQTVMNLDIPMTNTDDVLTTTNCTTFDGCTETTKKRKMGHNEDYTSNNMTSNNTKRNNNDSKSDSNNNYVNFNTSTIIDINNMEKELIYDICTKKAEAFVIIISSDFLYKTKTNVYILVDTLIKISLKYLNNDSKIIIQTDDFNISNLFIKFLIHTNSFINIKLNEYILREQQIVKRRTHPVIKNSKLADGFLLTALKVLS
ncbi:tRNA (adenine(58)-N(1))-methyltransferase non-catalytic subunit TRM6, putative [Hepatocystis sp. ex Piliocolobus tephrosceles]|nr:tRNA (adenine(58)-N(1))-methyltransferase non-catalytic subunit TRM6, putative [Hepatocystis sp. ex Piliocolobus tephrosceles]